MTAHGASAVDIWVDFVSDFHDGADGPPNGVADWIDELDEGTSRAGVAAFTPAERAQIEALVLADLERIYAGYAMDFILTEPAGLHEVIYMARDSDHPNVGSGNRGVATTDLGNLQSNDYLDRDGDPSGVARVTTANIARFAIQPSEPRSQQIAEVAAQVSGTAGHELGHAIGLEHFYVYTDASIGPATYGDTGGVQNQYLMATGATGIQDPQREGAAILSSFSRVALDIAGGSLRRSSRDELQPLVAPGPIFSDRAELGAADAGTTFATAQPLSFTAGATSGREISFVEADLDATTADRDWFRFETNVPVRLISHAVSDGLSLRGEDEFDPRMALRTASGQLIFASDDVAYDGDEYDDQVSPASGASDPMLVNLDLPPGEYVLEVEATTVNIEDFPEVGAVYWLVTALEVLGGPALPGDYNGDGSVDAADYTVYRDTSGATVSLVFNGADGNGDASVTPADYAVWATNYGPLGRSAAVPEPGAGWLVVLSTLIKRPRRARRNSALFFDEPRRHEGHEGRVKERLA